MNISTMVLGNMMNFGIPLNNILYLPHPPQRPKPADPYIDGFFYNFVKIKTPRIMKKFIQWLLTPVVFHQFNNGKFLKLEILYLAFSIALIPATYRSGTTVTMGFPDSFGDFLFTLVTLIPFLFLVFIVIRAKFYPSIYQLSDVPKEWWISRLSLSYKWWFTKTPQDLKIQEQLAERFFHTFGVRFKEGKMHWTHYIQFVILIVPNLVSFHLGVNI